MNVATKGPIALIRAHAVRSVPCSAPDSLPCSLLGRGWLNRTIVPASTKPLIAAAICEMALAESVTDHALPTHTAMPAIVDHRVTAVNLTVMYVPAHFAADDATTRELLARHGAADLVTVTEHGLLATLLPFVYEPDVGEHGALHGHVARTNDQWRTPAIGDALVIVRGPDAYVSPSWYAAKAEHGRVVPTWNYLTAHVYGTLVVHDDPAWVDGLVRRLTTKHESGRPAPWSVDDAPPRFVQGQLRAIVGVELLVTRVEAKAKLSQNRPAADVAGVVDGLTAAGEHASADAVRRHAP